MKVARVVLDDVIGKHVPFGMNVRLKVGTQLRIVLQIGSDPVSDWNLATSAHDAENCLDVLLVN